MQKMCHLCLDNERFIIICFNIKYYVYLLRK